MEAHLIALAALSLAMFAYAYWVYRVLPEKPHMSGDQWYMTQAAYTDEPISAPYCWRPLVPMMARRLGFPLVTYSATIATPFVIYGYLGGGWTGFLAASLFIGNNNLFTFSVKNPEYADGVGQFLLISTVWALTAGSPLAWPLLLLCALCRETITAALGVFVLFVNPWFLIPLIVGSVAAYLGRKEDKDNQHPLVEKTAYETVKRFGRLKGLNALHYAHTVQPLRAIAVAVPFMWSQVEHLARVGLLGVGAIWLLALPASGQSRIMCYGFVFFLPFFAALSVEWQGFFVFITWFWPADIRVFDEGGDSKFAYSR